MQTVRHFFPEFNARLDRLPDTRLQEACTYDKRFLAWWGIHLYLLQFGSRRQLDYELRDGGPQALLPACPENALQRTWGDGRVQTFRWVRQLVHEDSARRSWKLNALEGTETTADGARQYFAWLTALPVGRKTVEAIAQQGGRYSWKVENEGFNRQKNSGLNLEHVYSTDPENWKVYYLLLQIAFLLVQLLERGSLLRRLAAEAGRPFWKLFGSLKNGARRLLDRVRFVA